MASISLDLGDRDTKRWHVCLSCLVKELEELKDKKVNSILKKFEAEVNFKGGVGLGLLFPEGYKVPQELI